MTEPLRKYHSSDVPEYSSYPAEPDRPVAAIEFQAVSELDAMPAVDQGSIEESARKVGHALGRVVKAVRDLPHSLRGRVRGIEDDIDIARTTAEQTFSDARNKLASAARRSLREARKGAGHLRRKVAHTTNEYPVETLAVVGIAGVIAGVGLRIWRENRD